MSEESQIDTVLNSEPLFANGEIQKFLSEVNLISKQIKDLENMKEKIKAQVMAYMRDRDLLIDDGGVILATWKFSKGAVRFDAKELQKYDVATYDKYLRESPPIRRFLIKGEI